MAPNIAFDHPDLHLPQNPNPAKLHPRDEIVTLLESHPVLMSTGGQMFIYLPSEHSNFHIVPLDGDQLRAWVSARLVDDDKPVPSDSQFRNAIRIIRDRFLAGENRHIRRPVHNRYAWDSQHRLPVVRTDAKGKVTFDYENGSYAAAYILSLNTLSGRHIAITADTWLAHPSFTEFLLDPNEQPIPQPVSTAADPHEVLQPFRQLLRLDRPAQNATWQTLLDWMLSAMRPPKDAAFHEYPILNLMGSEASGKSVTAKLITQLLDPTLTPIHCLPNTERRLHGLAADHHILTFDDTGKINPEKSRYLSRLSSGITSLHKKLEGVLVRPIILTTNDETETKHLASRIVDIDLPPIEQPLTPEQISQQFDKLRPQIMAALLTLLSLNFNTPVPHLPNRKSKNQKIEESVTKFLRDSGGTWEGIVTDLQSHLDLPISVKALSAALDEMESINLTRFPRKNAKRSIRLDSLVLV